MSIKSKMMGTTLMSVIVLVYDGRREALTNLMLDASVRRLTYRSLLGSWFADERRVSRALAARVVALAKNIPGFSTVSLNKGRQVVSGESPHSPSACVNTRE